ncbi:MAG: hypothetical protein ACLSA6_08225 [Holdemania massiliensis]
MQPRRQAISARSKRRDDRRAEQLTAEEIAAADVVIVAHDIAVGGMERFAGKPTVDIPISVAMKNPKSLIATIEKKIQNKKVDESMKS